MRPSRILSTLFAVPIALAHLLLASCGYLDHFRHCPCDEAPSQCVCKKPSVMALAADLDHLEKHIDRYGSAVAMQPSVWGQARMTRHREEVERELEKDLDDFQKTLQGSLSRTDQAYFANATALSAAVSGRSAGLFAPRPRVVVNNSTATAAEAVIEEPKDKIAIPALDPDPNAFKAFAIGDDGLARTKVRAGEQLKFKAQAESISLEPTVMLDQKARYLHHLNELRRINEGDDTADSPGYALNLVRIPVSVLPGSHTREGYGAEVTMTLTPYLGDDLLPTTFRNLILNDLVDQIGVPLTELINDPDMSLFGEISDGKAAEFHKAATPEEAADVLTKANKSSRTPAVGTDANSAARVVERLDKGKAFARTTLPATKLRRAFLPFPQSQLIEVYGLPPAGLILRRTYQTFKADPSSKHPCDAKVFAHLPSVQGFLREQLNAANQFLSETPGRDLWKHCTPQLAQAVRARNTLEIQKVRDAFFHEANAVAGADPDESDPQVQVTLGTTRLTIALAWSVVVESALLNEQLVKDMSEAASLKGCGCNGAGHQAFFMPNPTPEARQAFNAYVQCRWPIHVFALDPVAQQQNLADTFSARRETQLALSLAFASGQISARNMSRYARRIEVDMETIDLNNTTVGFSHGNETFGWRFYPRYQTPDIESNATVFARDLLVGGPSRDALLRQRRLEPGQRECVAVVIMPSFVPTATLNVSSNWFKVTHPKHKELTSTDAMRLSRTVKAIQNCSANVDDADCYRDGDYSRLLAKAKQLETRLPLQSTQVQIPFENTLGGFAMFNNGVTDLAPELYGWYGAAQARTDKATTVFLVGNHFSVHQTRVVCGGQNVAPVKESMELLSRQVMRVTIPAGAVTVRDGDREYVTVQVATPYGVTPPLLIPTTCPPKPPAAPVPVTQVRWKDTALAIGFVYQPTGGIGLPAVPLTQPPALTLSAGGAAPFGTTTANVTLQFAAPHDKTPPVVVRGVPYVNGEFSIAGDKLFGLQAELLLRFGTAFGPEALKPVVPVAVSAALDYFGPGNVPQFVQARAANELTISWIKLAK